MPGFNYRVIDLDGTERKGNMNASTPEQVEKRLDSEGLIVVEVDRDDYLDGSSVFGRGRIRNTDYATFCRQLSHFLRAGIGTVNALKMMAEQTENKRLVNVINYLIDHVMEGDPLSLAMSNSDVFPDVLVAVAEAGETSGNLVDYLEMLALHYDKTNEREEMVSKSVRYPVFMFVLTLAVITGVLAFVVPGYMSMLNDVDIVLPASTKVILALSTLLTAKWWIVVLLILVLCIIVGAIHYSAKGRVLSSKFRINYHGICNHRQLEDCACFTRLMSTMLYAGIPLSKALELAGNSFKDHILFRRAILRVRDQVAAGGSLAKNLGNASILPPLLVNMVAIGEESGSLKEMFENAADYYETQFANAVKRMTAILEPIIIIVLAVLLGVVVMSLVKPLILLYEAVGSM